MVCVKAQPQPWSVFPVGSPIRVEKVEDPSDAEIASLHSTYIVALQDLFETHKEKYGVDSKRHLNIL